MNECDADLQSFLSPTEVENRYSAIHGILRGFEYKITETLKEVIRSTLASLKSYVESEIEKINGSLKNLQRRIESLERNEPSPREGNNQPTQKETTHLPVDIGSVQTQLEQISATVSNQQKMLEMSERTNKANNLVITGVKESEGNEDTGAVEAEIFESKMGMNSIPITQAHRLGRKMISRTNPRPILLTLRCKEDKRLIFTNRTKLAGTRMYINDLSKEQRQAEKKLRDIQKKLTQNPDFQGKKVTIFRGKLCVDGSPYQMASYKELAYLNRDCYGRPNPTVKLNFAHGIIMD